MRQILQNLKDGTVTLTEIPCPKVRPGYLLIRSSRSLISAGTERMLVEFGRANLLSKARQHPERVKQVRDKIRTDGLLPTLDAVFSRLDEPMPLGYCNAGTVLEVGAGVTGFEVGNRVISNGSHAEIVCVPKNLCARIPDGVSDDDAAFTVLAAVGLQGVRLTNPTLGETVVVLGLGLVGLMTVQLLRANGCRVLGLDTAPERVELARKNQSTATSHSRFEVLSEAVDAVSIGMDFSQGRGVDAVLITASTSSNEPVHQAAQMCRKRGRIVLVGVTGLELNRSDFYEKELSFQVSCSYGPGRYDPAYEEAGNDYPLGFVRWTEGRNFEAVLELMASGQLNLKPLLSHRFPFEKSPEAYDLIVNRREPYLGVVLEYPVESATPTAKSISLHHLTSGKSSIAHSEPTIGVIGAGDFTKRVILPALKRTDARLKTIASAGGVSGTHLGKRFGFEQTVTDYHLLLDDPEIRAVFITTRHNQHAQMAVEALEAGKHPFVEKPLAITEAELRKVASVRNTSDRLLHVGFNRRFAPHVQKIKQLLQNRTQPLSMVMTVNAGSVPPDHWIQDPAIGGGRIIGEVCHFIDLLAFLADAPIVSVSAQTAGTKGGQRWEDTVSLTLHFADGSIGTVHYFSNGHRSYPKERLEVFSEGRVLQLDNFRKLSGYGWKGFRGMRLRRQDKGHNAEVAAFIERITKGGEPLIPFEQLSNVTAATFAVMDAARTGQQIEIEVYKVRSDDAVQCM
jgi:predicted dehydrogenase/threonine dehydrogenase-like Zn-dependent dehydrogenase